MDNEQYDDLAGSEPPQSLRSSLLNLPAELRLRIYEEALAPTGVLCLHTTSAKRFALTPAITAASALATCRQIYHEAKTILYKQNVVTFAVDAHDNTWPIISESRLPQHVLKRLEHICVILDCTATLYSGYQTVDFDAFSALVSLKTLQLGVLYDVRNVKFVPGGPSLQAHPDEVCPCVTVLAEVLRRVPANVKIISSVDPASSQRKAVEQRIDMRRGQRQEADRSALVSLSSARLDEAIALIPSDLRGELSDGVTDVFAAFYEENGFAERRIRL